jgi:Zn-dependent peptidase ImmA (M78 family)/DNA-binding XRE family transcriptional regulator
MTLSPLMLPVASGAAISVGARIRRAREHRGLTQTDLADCIGTAQSTISLWEKGRRSPNLDELVALADALDLEIGSLFEESRPQRSRRVLLRAEATLRPLDELAETIDDFANAAESLEPLAIKIRVASDNPVRAAQELLAQSGVTTPPIPVEKLARRCGINVKDAPFGNEISGVLLELDSGPVIGFNAEHPSTRQRFTIAHELGHFLLSHHDHFHIDLSDLAGHGEPPGYDWRDERAANEFAAELLMPASLVTQAYGEDPDLPRLAAKFKVSKEALGFRLVNLRLVT